MTKKSGYNKIYESFRRKLHQKRFLGFQNVGESELTRKFTLTSKKSFKRI